MKFRLRKIGFFHGFLHTGNTGCDLFNQMHAGK
jgi:hypothetical protein